ncbi:ATP-binding protein [Thermococcus sibiricus]|uniref:Predicted ATPase, AAA superfamily n=1 Tax=Thermococcus sibiricus (strain DSM 12597 / MM 739) TaxID=604354 RepID=C6A079_THESM|nr:ATP-binding protein [Thermococcus sibiricus]ACS91060.1 Predicted ATPase, AAA superfamily [Thermococcus sibiricus MM 739]
MISKEVWARIIRDYLEWDVKLVERNINYSIPKVQRALVIIGPRRAGKTYFMFQIIKELLKQGVRKEETIYINLEDPRIIDTTLDDLLGLLDVYYSQFPENVKGHNYFFLDEIQTVKNWEKFVRFLLDKNQRVIVSGSSSRLLSKEIATELRGRSVPIRVYPFSFREILVSHGIKVDRFYSTYEEAKIKKLLRQYLLWGGYPEVVLDFSLRREILREIIDLMIYKDIVERWGIVNIKALKLLFRMLAFSTHLSISKAYKNLKGIGINVGKTTVANYLEFLEDSLVFYPLRALIKSYKLQELYGFKPYLVDNGLLTSLGVQDEGRLLENLVFTELLKFDLEPNRDVFYYRTRDGKEVDFVILEKGRIKQAIQVTYELNESNYEREISALVGASKELNCRDLLLITWDQEETIKKKGKEIKVMPLWKWLLPK